LLTGEIFIIDKYVQVIGGESGVSEFVDGVSDSMTKSGEGS